jgi:hypothetical protein
MLVSGVCRLMAKVINTDASVVGTDVMSSGSVVDVIEGSLDAVVMTDFIEDAGASCVVSIIYAGASDGSGVSLSFDSNAVCGTCCIMDSVCINHDDHGSMEME